MKAILFIYVTFCSASILYMLYILLQSWKATGLMCPQCHGAGCKDCNGSGIIKIRKQKKMSEAEE